MSKNSKPCGYTGRMHTMNRENIGKRVFDTEKSKINLELEHESATQHQKKGSGVVYPETPCTCKK